MWAALTQLAEVVAPRETAEEQMAYACRTGDCNKVRELMSQGLDLYGRNEYSAKEAGNTYLHIAAEAGQLDTVQLLLEAGIPTDERGKNGALATPQRALSRAAGYTCLASSSSPSCGREKRKDRGVCGMRPAAVGSACVTPLPCVARRPPRPPSDVVGNTVLIAASVGGNKEMVEYLINSGCDATATNHKARFTRAWRLLPTA